MAEKPISPLRRLEAAAVRLNRLTDQAGEEVRQLEARLNEFSIGLTISVPITGGRNGKSLDYRRADDRLFQIAVVRHTQPPKPDEVRPWDQCSREDKIQAFKVLPELIEKLTQELEGRVADTEAALESLSHVLQPPLQGVLTMAAARSDVPRWVRNATCVIGAASVPSLIVASTFGANVSGWVASAVAFYALHVASLAFGHPEGRLLEVARLLLLRGRGS